MGAAAPSAKIWALDQATPSLCVEVHSPLQAVAASVAFDEQSSVLLWGTKRGGVVVFAWPSMRVLGVCPRAHGTTNVSCLGVVWGELVTGGHDGCVRRFWYGVVYAPPTSTPRPTACLCMRSRQPMMHCSHGASAKCRKSPACSWWQTRLQAQSWRASRYSHVAVIDERCTWFWCNALMRGDALSFDAIFSRVPQSKADRFCAMSLQRSQQPLLQIDCGASRGAADCVIFGDSLLSMALVQRGTVLLVQGHVGGMRNVENLENLNSSPSHSEAPLAPLATTAHHGREIHAVRCLPCADGAVCLATVAEDGWLLVAGTPGAGAPQGAPLPWSHHVGSGPEGTAMLCLDARLLGCTNARASWLVVCGGGQEACQVWLVEERQEGRGTTSACLASTAKTRYARAC